MGAETMVANQRGDWASAWRQFDLLESTIGNLPPDDPVQEAMSRV